MSDGSDLNGAGTGADGQSIIADGGGAAGASTATLPAYMAQLPDNLKDNSLIAENATIGDLANKYIELHGKADGAVKLPGEGSTDEERQAFMKALGIPDTADSYQINVDTLPEGLTLTEEGVKEMKAIAHELALNPKQAQGIFDKWNARQAEQAKATTDARKKSFEDGTTALKTEWGADYESNVAKAAKAIESFGGATLKAELVKLGNADNNPVLLRMFHAMGERISEDASMPGAGGGGSKTPKVDGHGRALLVQPTK